MKTLKLILATLLLLPLAAMAQATWRIEKTDNEYTASGPREITGATLQEVLNSMKEYFNQYQKIVFDPTATGDVRFDVISWETDSIRIEGKISGNVFTSTTLKLEGVEITGNITLQTAGRDYYPAGVVFMSSSNVIRGTINMPEGSIFKCVSGVSSNYKINLSYTPSAGKSLGINCGNNISNFTITNAGWGLIKDAYGEGLVLNPLLRAGNGTGGTITREDDILTASGIPLLKDEPVVLTAKANSDCYEFVNWTASGISIAAAAAKNPVLEFLMPNVPVQVTANFSDVCTATDMPITISSTAGGNAKASKTTASKDETITLTAEPDEGYTFVQWVVKSGNVSIANIQGAITTFKMPERAVSVEAEFESNELCTITITSTAGGTARGSVLRTLPRILPKQLNTDIISAAGDMTEESVLKAIYREIVQLTATPLEGYRFKQWVVKGDIIAITAETSPDAMFVMPPRAVALEAVFEDENTISPIISHHATSAPTALAVKGGVLLQNLPKNAKIELYNMHGERIYFANSENSQTLKISVQTKGIYIAKINNEAMKIAVK